jgi:hypothetical protein
VLLASVEWFSKRKAVSRWLNLAVLAQHSVNGLLEAIVAAAMLYGWE